MGYILKFRSPNLYTIIILTKIKRDFLKKEERVKGFFIFMTVLSFKQVESNYKSYERSCSWITKQGIIQTKMEVSIQFWVPNLGLSPKYD